MHVALAACTAWWKCHGVCVGCKQYGGALCQGHVPRLCMPVHAFMTCHSLTAKALVGVCMCPQRWTADAMFHLVRCRIHFLINNLSIDTVDAKVKDIKDRIWPEYQSWFANYMVVRRAAQEANYHTLYISLIDK